MNINWPEKSDLTKHEGYQDTMNMSDAYSAGYDAGRNEAIDDCKKVVEDAINEEKSNG